MPSFPQLDALGFAPFGHVAAPGQGSVRQIRGGAVQLTHSDARLSHDADAPDPALDFYQVAAAGACLDITQAERHRHSSQVFVPLTGVRYLVLVWPGHPDDGAPLGFAGRTEQAVIYNPGIWHHGIVALDTASSFASLMWRTRGGQDTEFHTLARPLRLDLPALAGRP